MKLTGLAVGSLALLLQAAALSPSRGTALQAGSSHDVALGNVLTLRGGARNPAPAVAAKATKVAQNVVPAKGVTDKVVPVGTGVKNWKYNLKIGSYFLLWYSLNIGYNITNKKALNMCAAPLTLSALQMLVGVVYIVPLWLFKLRPAPVVSSENIKTLWPIGACHAASHLSAVVGLGAGSVSFTHIIKAAEPFFTALWSAIFLRQFFPLPVYLSLVPVVGGVAYASTQELNFNKVAFAGAMGSNIAASTRAILAKKSMTKPKGKNMGAANLYGVLTIIATVMLIPIALLFEGSKVQGAWDAALLKGHTAQDITTQALLSGLFFYLYNEVAFLALDAVHPVVHAVGNTLKRVFLIGTGVVFFGNKLTQNGMVGSGVAILGVLVFSLIKEHYAKQPPKSWLGF